MSIQALRAVLLRDLSGVRAQLEAYPSDAEIWQCPPAVPNSAGTLAIHIAGNLLHFIGAGLGNTGYVRDRDAEFAARDLPRGEINRRLDQTRRVVGEALGGLDEARAADPFPLEIAGMRHRTDIALAHIAAHLAYHLGQIDIHRRLVTGRHEGLGMVSPKALA